MRDAVASKWTGAKQRKHDDRKLGTFGAASPVRFIVKDGKPVDMQEASDREHHRD